MESYQKELSRIRALLKAHPHGLTVTDIAKKIDINRNSIAKYLDILLISGQVEKRVVGKAKVYSLSHRVPISAILSLSSDAIVIIDQKKKSAARKQHIPGMGAPRLRRGNRTGSR